MNEDFSEVISKFKNILQEKNIELPNTSETSSDFNIDINTILKIKSMLSEAKDKTEPIINLLNSLKPFLHREASDKLEEYKKFINIIGILFLLM